MKEYFTDCWTYPKELINEMQKDIILNCVPVSRTVNGHALDNDIELSASDVGAVPISENATINTEKITGSNAIVTFQKYGKIVCVTGYIPTTQSVANNDIIATGLPVPYGELTLYIQSFDHNEKVSNPVLKIDSSGNLKAHTNLSGSTSIRFGYSYISKN